MELRYGTKHALIFQDEILLGKSLELSIRIVGAKPSIRRLHNYIKHVWNIETKFIVKESKHTPFSVAFSTIPDFFRVTDRTWGFIDDMVIKVPREAPEVLHKENFKTIPHWILITGMWEVMWSCSAISAINSTLGTPRKAEHLHSPWVHALSACVMIDFSESIPSTIQVLVIKNGRELLVSLKVRIRSIPTTCVVC